MAFIPPAAQKLLRFWEIPFLAILAGWMFYIRMLPYKALVGSGRSFFIGTDPFYNYRETLGIVRAAFPDRTVVGVETLGLTYGGGGVHCVTQQVPRV